MPRAVKTSDKTRNARLEVRIPSVQKDFFQRAAVLAGSTLSEFVIESMQKAAAKVVQEHDLIRLARVEQIAFVSALLSPSVPGARLRQGPRAIARNGGCNCLWYWRLSS